MRCADKVVKSKKGLIYLCYRFLGKYIQSGAGNFSAFQRLVKRLFINHTATGTVNKHGVIFHVLEDLGGNAVFGLICKRHVNRDIIRPFAEFLKRHRLNTFLFHKIRGHIGIIRKDLHAKPFCAVCKNTSDPADPENTHGFTGNFSSHEFLLFPFAGLHGGRGLGNIPGKRHNHGKGVLRSRNGVAFRSIHDNDAFFRC